MPARLGSKNAEAVLGIMIRDTFDETGKSLLRPIRGWVFHGRCDRIADCICMRLRSSRRPGGNIDAGCKRIR
jgi:hypothetical protein